MENLVKITVVTETLEISIFSDLRAATFGRQDLPPHSVGKGKFLTAIYPASGKLWDFLNPRLFTMSKISLTSLTSFYRQGHLNSKLVHDFTVVLRSHAATLLGLACSRFGSTGVVLS
jgi:hypothetical protein